jgi:UDP-glucuronate decarboxylase
MAEDDGRVVSNFIVQALRGEPLTIYGDGEQTRSFCYVSDLVEGIVGMMETEDFHGPVNLGNPEEYRVLDLAQWIIELTGSRSAIDFHPLPEDDPRQRRPDITLARERLGWAPTVRVEEGLRRTIDYFRSVDLNETPGR